MNRHSYKETIRSLEETLTQLKTQAQDFVELTEKAMGLCDSVMSKFRVSVLKYGFSSKEEEIHFFKHVKPKVESRFIFYTELFILEAHRPHGECKVQVKYLQNEIVKTPCLSKG